jgi:hypothetical protein
MADLRIHDWWNEPRFRECLTPELRGEFILRKLMQHDPSKCRKVLRTTCGTPKLLPVRLAPSQWQLLLGAMGASLVEISEVLIRLGLTWQ